MRRNQKMSSAYWALHLLPFLGLCSYPLVDASEVKHVAALQHRHTILAIKWLLAYDAQGLLIMLLRRSLARSCISVGRLGGR